MELSSRTHTTSLGDDFVNAMWRTADSALSVSTNRDVLVQRSTNTRHPVVQPIQHSAVEASETHAEIGDGDTCSKVGRGSHTAADVSLCASAVSSSSRNERK